MLLNSAQNITHYQYYIMPTANIYTYTCIATAISYVIVHKHNIILLTSYCIIQYQEFMIVCNTVYVHA